MFCTAGWETTKSKAGGGKKTVYWERKKHPPAHARTQKQKPPNISTNAGEGDSDNIQVLMGGAGNDTITSNSTSDIVIESIQDVTEPNPHITVIDGGDDDDDLNGGDGNEILDGGLGNDNVQGNGG